MAKKPKYGRSIKPFTFRPRPDSEETVNEIIKTGRVKSDVLDEALALGLPIYLRRNPLPKQPGTEAATA